MYANTFFDENFGMSDFQEVNPVLLKRGGTLKYLIKYIVKTGEKFVYSRGVLVEIYKKINDDEIAVDDVVKKNVLFDNDTLTIRARAAGARSYGQGVV